MIEPGPSAPAAPPTSAIGRLDHVVGGPARRRVILLLAAVLGLQSADSGAIGSLAAPIEGAFHVGDTGLGLLVTVSTLAGAVGTLPFGVLADRVRRVRVLEAAVLVWGAATVVSALSVSFAMLLVARVALGVLVAAAGPFVVSLAGDLFPADERSRLFGFVLTGELIGAGFGIVVAGALSGLVGWRPALGVLALPAVALAWGLRRSLPEPARGGQSVLQIGALVVPASTEDRAAHPPGADAPPSPAAEGPSLVEMAAQAHHVEPAPGVGAPPDARAGLVDSARYILSVRTNLVLIVASGLGYFFLQGLETFAELYLRDRYGVSQAVASALFVVVAAGAVAGVLVSGRISDRRIRSGHPDARPLVAGVAFVAAAVLFLPGLAAPSLAVAVPLFLVAAAALGAINPPLDAARLDVMPSTMWGRAESVRTALRTLLMGSAPLLFGFASQAYGGGQGGLASGINATGSSASAAAGAGLGRAFATFTIPLLVAGVVLFAARRRYVRDVLATGPTQAGTRRRTGS